MQNAIVILIVAVAAGYLLFRGFRVLTSDRSPGCGGCNSNCEAQPSISVVDLELPTKTEEPAAH